MITEGSDWGSAICLSCVSSGHNCIRSLMSESLNELLLAFDRMTAADQRSFVLEILRRVRDMEWPSLEDEDLARIADENFLEYDDHEAQQADRAEPPDGRGMPQHEMKDHE